MKWNVVKITLLNEVIIKQDKKMIARLMGDNEDADYPTEQEREQNAKLIAAAPELLEALIKATQELKFSFASQAAVMGFGEQKIKDFLKENTLIIELEAAIKKATE